MNRFKLCTLLLLFFGVGPAYSISFGDLSIEELFDNSPVVVKVKITSGELSRVNVGNETIHCGVIYQGEIIELFKGSVTTSSITFRESGSLGIGQDYLLFLSSRDEENTLVFLAMGRNDNEKYDACVDTPVNYFASGFFGNIFEMSPYIGADIDDISYLYKFEADHVNLPNEWNTTEYMYAQGVDINSYAISAMTTSSNLYPQVIVDDYVRSLSNGQ